MRPQRVVAAIPVAPPDGAQRLSGEADDVLCLHRPMMFYAVGQFYDDFAQTTDDEVIALLRRREEDRTAGGEQASSGPDR
jgi:predicted phosphoribosyltransferase